MKMFNLKPMVKMKLYCYQSSVFANLPKLIICSLLIQQTAWTGCCLLVFAFCQNLLSGATLSKSCSICSKVIPLKSWSVCMGVIPWLELSLWPAATFCLHLSRWTSYTHLCIVKHDAVTKLIQQHVLLCWRISLIHFSDALQHHI